MKYVTCYGVLYKLTTAKYRLFLKKAAADEEWNLEELGVQVAMSVPNVTDLDEGQAKELLEELNSKPKKRRVRTPKIARPKLSNIRFI